VRIMIPERSDLLEKIYGVGFSGTAEADKKIWIASALVETGFLPIGRHSRGGGLSKGRTGRDPSVSQHIVGDDVCEVRGGRPQARRPCHQSLTLPPISLLIGEFSQNLMAPGSAGVVLHPFG